MQINIGEERNLFPYFCLVYLFHPHFLFGPQFWWTWGLLNLFWEHLVLMALTNKNICINICFFFSCDIQCIRVGHHKNKKENKGLPTKEHTLPFSKHPTFNRRKVLFNNLPSKYNRNVMLVFYIALTLV